MPKKFLKNQDLLKINLTLIDKKEKRRITYEMSKSFMGLCDFCLTFAIGSPTVVISAFAGMTKRVEPMRLSSIEWSYVNRLNKIVIILGDL
jgi:hypothetical protein